MTSNHWEIIATIMRLSNTIEPMLANHLHRFGFGLTDLRLLIMIRLHGGIAQKTLAAKTGLSQGVVSNRLDRMEHLGWITRNHVGRRLVAVALTEAGAELLELSMQSLDVSVPLSALLGLHADDEERLIRSLRRLVQVMGHPIERSAPADALPLIGTPVSALKERLTMSRAALDRALEASDFQLTEAVRRLGDELDDLVRAYMILSKDHTDSAEGRNK